MIQHRGHVGAVSGGIIRVRRFIVEGKGGSAGSAATKKIEFREPIGTREFIIPSTGNGREIHQFSLPARKT
jgi:hypothetical protein